MIVLHPQLYRVAQGDGSGDQLFAQGILHQALNHPAQRTRAIFCVKAFLGQIRHHVLAIAQVDVPFRQALFQLAEEQTGNLADVRFLQGMEHNQLIHPVDKLRPEQLLDLLHDGFLHGLVAAHVGHASAAKAQGAARINGMCTGVAGHDDDGILEADHPARVVREASILQNLQEDIEHIRVRLFHLVQEHHAVRLAAHCLGKLAAFLISHVARGGAHQAGGGVFLHVLGHIHTDYAVLVPKHGLPQGATPVGPRKIKEPMGCLGSFSPARARRMARLTALTASSWPITR